MEVLSSLRGDVLIVTVTDTRIDAAGAIAFKEAMREVTEVPSARVILDLSHVAFLDSSGLGAVVAAMKLLGPDRPLELAGLTATVEKVFRLTRMDTVFRIHARVSDGIQAAG